MNADSSVVMGMKMFQSRVPGGNLRLQHDHESVFKREMMPGFLFYRNLGGREPAQKQSRAEGFFAHTC